ncbi:UDP-N-acetylmuramoyl-L-alanyl-D-glutamate--2,6-diaminopimelate ligase [Endozoicomonas sp. SCSIO W0465]|uniref:UDP-N-acetylmuramoyl-L-alanyl-D-glutamate--2, 6-diaminopimelate ligase n=1 Tax=Endozoicomonas sp. SCSIO W0465 TaxID=2918516 RepID=UPI002074EB10|nr:UDP-N-acetylmuramoyl-L-alanyl-D-glutamate--2,6-diaminopimelate ligase [Endozoicomonas sp. SCSIO W0465]USE34881.1 UDP-N-acetylmuramoyl-L-alanyl-D-glutamate--2,6-diaminopimelate ligase [Endozoicomonas sp. SCSIO W0465]
MTAEQENTLNGVLTELQLPAVAVDRKLNHMTLDSRKITGGELFIAIPGIQSDGRKYIAEALEKGAAAVLVDDSEGYDVSAVAEYESVFIVPGLSAKVGFLAHHFYRQPSELLNIMGVTGTNGKTSCCWFIAEILRQLGKPCAVMGTVGRGLPGQMKASLNTTSDVVSLQQYLGQLVTDGVQALAMEVSSHGLDQGRVSGVAFEVALFTHISRDHLDYHGSLENYAGAKARLFSECNYRYAVIGKDDAFSPLMLSSCPASANVTTWSLEDASADVYLSSIETLPQGFRATIHTPWGVGKLNTSLLGRFNLENLLAIVAVLGVQGYSLDRLLAAIPEISAPPGRMQQFGGGNQPLVLVDYAHTPDAIESVLSSLREHRSQIKTEIKGFVKDSEQGVGNIVCIYGCGGDRDRGKRPLMTAAALKGADRAVLTSDNPRTEDPLKIIADALEDITPDDRRRIQVIADRSEAIRSTMASASAGDIIVIAGKGHEDYQEIHGVRHHFDDAEQVQLVFQSQVRSVPLQNVQGDGRA